MAAHGGLLRGPGGQEGLGGQAGQAGIVCDAEETSSLASSPWDTEAASPTSPWHPDTTQASSALGGPVALPRFEALTVPRDCTTSFPAKTLTRPPAGPCLLSPACIAQATFFIP